MGRVRIFPDFKGYKNISPIPIFKNELEIIKYIRGAISYIYNPGIAKKSTDSLKKRSDEFKEILNDASNFEFIEKKIREIIIQLGCSFTNDKVFINHLRNHKKPFQYTHEAVMCQKNIYWTALYTSQTLNLDCLNYMIQNEDLFRGVSIKHSITNTASKQFSSKSKVPRTDLIGREILVSIKRDDLFQFLTVYFNQNIFEFSDSWMKNVLRLTLKKVYLVDDDQQQKLSKEYNIRYDEKEFDNNQIIDHKIKDGIFKLPPIGSTLESIAKIMSQGTIEECKTKTFFIEILYDCFSCTTCSIPDQDSIKYIVNLLMPHLHPLDYKRFSLIPKIIDSKEFVDFLIENKEFYQLIPSVHKFTKKYEKSNYFSPEISRDGDNDEDYDEDIDNNVDDTIQSIQEYKDNVTVYLNTRQRFLEFSSFEIANYFHTKLLDSQKEFSNSTSSIISSIIIETTTTTTTTTTKPTTTANTDNNNTNIKLRSRLKTQESLVSNELKAQKQQQLQSLQKMLNGQNFSNKEYYYLLFLKAIINCDVTTIESIDRIVSCSSNENDNKFQVLFQQTNLYPEEIRNGISFRFYDYKVGYHEKFGPQIRQNVVDDDDDDDDDNDKYEKFKIQNSIFYNDAKARDQLLKYLKSSGFKCFTPSTFCYLVELLLSINTEKSNEQFEEIFKPITTSTNFTTATTTAAKTATKTATTTETNNINNNDNDNINERIFKLSYDLLIHLIHLVDYKKFSIIMDSVNSKRESIIEMIKTGKTTLSYSKRFYTFHEIQTKEYSYDIKDNFRTNAKFTDARDLLKRLINESIFPISKESFYIFDSLYISILQSTGVTLNKLVEINKIYQDNEIRFPEVYADCYTVNYITFEQNTNFQGIINYNSIVSNFVLFYWFHLLDMKISRIFISGLSNPNFKDFLRKKLSCFKSSNIDRIKSNRKSCTSSQIFELIFQCQDLEFFEKYSLFKSYFPEAGFNKSQLGDYYYCDRSNDFKTLVGMGEIGLAILHLQNSVEKKTVYEITQNLTQKLFQSINLEQIVELINLTTVKNNDTTENTPIIKMWYGSDVKKCKDWILKQAIDNSRIDIVELLLVKDVEYSASTNQLFSSYELINLIFNRSCDIDTMEYILKYSNGIILPSIKKYLNQDNFETQCRGYAFRVLNDGIGKFELLRTHIPSLTFNKYFIEKLIEYKRFETLQYYMEIGFITCDDLLETQKEFLKKHENFQYLDWVISLKSKKDLKRKSPSTSKIATTAEPLLQTKFGRKIIKRF
ncbi:hypothetical protein RB653_000690 [Dictyostelium firmibasis]|uniref:Uncharacterized protein n=1 Tax=Dictyostelium firmibasis TaxID=79012 RepID=A0AAN7TX51_9MYCE